ncbi:unnamed protein product [Ilex paraguariensis]|uniref:Uncharacterized protein n=1 Tax=Ilex paraguariensis TaxID=185542 RepID=A0ABC8TV79_9AQUA
MDVRNWCCSGARAIQLGCNANYDELEAVNGPTTTTGLKNQMWKLLWKKLLKDQKRKHGQAQFSYDEHNYSQNFDQGLTWVVPENLSRSFSVRFSDPSSKFSKKTVV